MKPLLAFLPLALAASSVVAASALPACSSTTTASDAGADATTAVDAAPLPTTTDAATDAAPPPPQDAGAKDAAADGGGGGALTPEEKLICDARASRAACAGGGTAEPCDEGTKCLYARISEPAAVASYAGCYGSPSCMGDDVCVAQAGEAVGGQASRDYVTACLAKVTECGAEFPDDELCSTAAYAYKGVGAGATACLAKSCAEQKACFDAVLKPIKDCKTP